jgi:hypothetical protein
MLNYIRILFVVSDNEIYLRRARPRAAPPQQLQRAHSPGTPVLCHTSYRRLERSQARASLPNQARPARLGPRAQAAVQETVTGRSAHSASSGQALSNI